MMPHATPFCAFTATKQRPTGNTPASQSNISMLKPLQYKEYPHGDR